MKDSRAWWNDVKRDQGKLLDWIKDQYHGEATARARFTIFLSSSDLTRPCMSRRFF